MFAVKSRRRLAAAIVIAFAVVSGTVTYIATRDYRPAALRTRAQSAFEDATGYRLTLDGGVISVNDSVTFDHATVSSSGRELLSAGAVTVTGLPKPLDRWRPLRVETTDVALGVSLSDKAGLDAVKALAELQERADALNATMPETATVTVSYANASAEYTAKLAGLARDKTLTLEAMEGAADKDWRFAVTPDTVTLDSSADGADDRVSKVVAHDAGASVLAAVTNPGDGRFKAVWSRGMLTAEFANVDGWRLTDGAVRSLTPLPAEAEIRAALTAFTVEGGAVTDMEGTFELSCAKVPAETVAKWLDLCGMQALPKDTPAELQNVRAAGIFALHDGKISIRPAAGKPGVIWSEGKESVTVLCGGGGEVGVGDFRARGRDSR